MESKKAKLRECIQGSGNIVFFGGAGVSTESNIPDFRSENGIYNAINKYGHPPEMILSYSFFISQPDKFYDFYKSCMIYSDARPNKAHLALAALEESGSLKAVITQNIDGLHQAAGSSNVLELHGSVHRNYCMDCGEKYGLGYITDYPSTVPKCDKCKGLVRPEVTLYEEALDSDILNRAVHFIRGADVLIVGGTSLAVYPAAGLIEYFKGSSLVLINKSATSYDDRADIVINESIGEVLGELIL